MRQRSQAIAILSCLLAGVALAGTQTANDPVDRLIERSGLGTQLTHFEGAMQRGISEAHAARRDLATSDVDRLRRAVATAYAPASLRPVLRKQLAGSLGGADVAAALTWLDSPTGRKLTALEEKAATPEAQRRIAAAAQGEAPQVSPERTRILHALITATRADAVGASLLIETAVGIAEGAALFVPGDPRAAVKKARDEMEAHRGQVVAAMHAHSFVAFSLVYAEASDAELAALLGFARSPAGARYHAAAARAFESTLAQAARRLGGALAAPAAPADI